MKVDTTRYARATPVGSGCAGGRGERLALSYVLPLRSERPLHRDAELGGYLARIGACCELLIVDGSPPEVFAAHHAAWSRHGRHVPPDPAGLTPMGKVGGVVTGVNLASHGRVIIADDDVRYGDELGPTAARLDQATVVRPQNYFSPLPWHGAWDSARMLLNRISGGDWPGTLAVRRDAFLAAGGYAGDVMFENFELVQTLLAAGGTELIADDVFVRRLPPTASHFWSQRVRQAYDEIGRPARLVPFLAVVPLVLGTAARRSWKPLAWGTVLTSAAATAAAEVGRRRRGARRYFPPRCSLLAPVWVGERSVCSWLALLARARGGVAYGGTRLRKACSPSRGRRRVAARRRPRRGGRATSLRRISQPEVRSRPGAGGRRPGRRGRPAPG